MNLRRLDMVAVAAAALVMTASCTAESPDSPPASAPRRDMIRKPPQRPDRVAGEYLVTAIPETTTADLHTLFAPFDPDRIEDRGKGSWLVHLRTDPGLARLQQLIRGSERVRAIQPNFLYYPDPAPLRR